MKLGDRVRRLWNSRELRTATAVIAVALFAFVLYRDQHRSYSTNTRSDLTLALVAKRPIPKGTTGAAISQRRLYKLAEVPRSQFRHGGVILSPSFFAGRFEVVANEAVLRNIPPGSVIHPADFGRTTR